MALVKTCPTCGFANTPISPFCSQCRVSLVAVAPSEQSLSHGTEANQQSAVLDKCICPDCQAENESGAERCVYCDCPLGSAVEQSGQFYAELTWPWGMECLLKTMIIGREPPAPDAFINAVGVHGYDNLSRAHAEFILDPDSGVLLIVDLGSTNGTFVDGVRIPANRQTVLHSGSVVRFAANLTAQVAIKASSQ